LFETGAEWICSKHVEHLLMKDTYDGIPWWVLSIVSLEHLGQSLNNPKAISFIQNRWDKRFFFKKW
jgi:hypothetical protein